mmetsp:Transcript_21934/g.38901  ORF Transcript_21934/g.38901 Transcript_21934/m.38901 type:complete len:205 (+) Transcript_21934:247-861(+)
MTSHRRKEPVRIGSQTMRLFEDVDIEASAIDSSQIIFDTSVAMPPHIVTHWNKMHHGNSSKQHTCVQISVDADVFGRYAAASNFCRMIANFIPPPDLLLYCDVNARIEGDSHEHRYSFRCPLSYKLKQQQKHIDGCSGLQRNYVSDESLLRSVEKVMVEFGVPVGDLHDLPMVVAGTIVTSIVCCVAIVLSVSIFQVKHARINV